MKTEFKIGLSLILSVLLFYWGINYMKGEDVFSSSKKFYVVYNNTSGLLVTRPVTINGHQVGQVADIDFVGDGTGRLLVTLRIDHPYPITKKSIAKIYSSSIMGEKSVALTVASGTSLASEGDTLIADVERDLTDEVNMQLAPIKARTQELIGSMDTAITIVTGFLDQETKENFRATFEAITQTVQRVQGTSEELERYIRDNRNNFDDFANNLSTVSGELANSSENITNTITNLSNLSDSLATANLAQTMNNVGDITERLSSILATVEDGTGTAGMLLDDEEVYQNLKEATENLNRLLLDIKYNPNKYLHVSVFGTRTRFSEEEIEALEEKKKEQNNPQ